MGHFIQNQFSALVPEISKYFRTPSCMSPGTLIWEHCLDEQICFVKIFMLKYIIFVHSCLTPYDGFILGKSDFIVFIFLEI